MTQGGPYRNGQRFGHYVLEEYLGAGAFKSVYRASRMEGTGPSVVALGFPHHQDSEGIEELKKEFSVCCRLDHPNIVGVHGLEQHEGISFLVMQYVEGPSLRELLRQNTNLPVEQALRYVGLLGDALAYAHAARVLHRDVKPENVLIASADGAPRLTDFGIARVLARSSDLASTRVGTVAYMAPEQINGAAGTNADLWALGVTFYELLTGRTPFTGEVGELIRKIMSGELDVQPLRDKKVDGRIIQVIRRMLNRDPEARYHTADDLVRDLESVARRARLVDSDETRLEVLIRASFPVINVVSFEEQRVVACVRRVADALSRERSRPRPVYLWSASRGLRDPQDRLVDASTLEDPTGALIHAIETPDDGIYILLDLHRHFTPVTTRLVRDAARAVRQSRKSLLLVTPFYQIPQELEKEVTVVGFQLPDRAQLEPLLERVMADVKMQGQPVELDREARAAVVRAALGLTQEEAERAFRRAAMMSDGLFSGAERDVVHEKTQIIRKTGILDYYHSSETLSSVGGLSQLLTWFAVRAKVFSAAACYSGPPLPKGVLLVGVPGCGKSLCARALAGSWGVPLLRLDVGRVFASVVGSSEANLRRAISTAEAVSPCVLWVDEIEKGLSGSRGSGVSTRVLGTLLTWLQEKKSPVFVVGTANSIEALPPELVRGGRFDEIFFVSLPSLAERRAIFEIHLSRRGRDPSGFDLDELARKTEGFSGAEIEQAVISGLYGAFIARADEPGRDLTTEDISAAVAETYPLSVSLGPQIERMIRWAENHARQAA
ncbi:MAG: protein kinase [Polyangiaceae bacterium]|nr:protein kinase [Polyangiaceae bacterium]